MFESLLESFMILPKINSFAASFKTRRIFLNGSAIYHAWHRRKFSIFQRGLQQDADGHGFSAHLGARCVQNMGLSWDFN
jgi:hypothetical protein